MGRATGAIGPGLLLIPRSAAVYAPPQDGLRAGLHRILCAAGDSAVGASRAEAGATWEQVLQACM